MCYILMNEENLLIDKKRQWIKDIRRKELDQIFSKKRAILFQTVSLKQDQVSNDWLRVDKIQAIISSFSLEQQIEILRMIVDLDHSLGLLFQVTGFLPNNLPKLVEGVIKEVTKTPIVCLLNINYEKYWLNPKWVEEKKPYLVKIYEIAKKWEKEESPRLDQIIHLFHELDDFNNGIEAEIVNYFSFIANVVSVGHWINELNELQSMKAQGQLSKMYRLRQSCSSILLNILAGPDQKILQYLPSVLFSVGGNLKFRGLYFNMFLVKGTSNDFKLLMLENYTKMLSRNRELLYEQHQHLIEIMMIGVEKLEISIYQYDQFYEVGATIVYLLDQLMNSLNLRYDNSVLLVDKSPDQEKGLRFVLNVTCILKKMAYNKDTLRMVIDSTAFQQLFINHLRISEHSTELSIAINIVCVLIDASCDEMASSQLLNEPRYVLKILAIIKKASETIGIYTEPKVFNLVSGSLMFLSNCCSFTDLYLLFPQNNIMEIISKIYPRIPKSKQAHRTRFECLCFFLNLILVTEQYILSDIENSNELINYFLRLPISKIMIFDLLDYRLEKLTLKKTINALSEMVTLSDQLPNNESLIDLLQDHQLMDLLKDLSRMNEALYQQADGLIKKMEMKRSRKRHLDWQDDDEVI